MLPMSPAEKPRPPEGGFGMYYYLASLLRRLPFDLGGRMWVAELEPAALVRAAPARFVLVMPVVSVSLLWRPNSTFGGIFAADLFSLDQPLSLMVLV